MKGNTGLITHYQGIMNSIADRGNTIDGIEATIDEDTRVKTETMRKKLESKSKVIKEQEKEPKISVEEFKKGLDKAIEEDFGRL